MNEAGATSAWRPPGYPAFLAAVYGIAGVRAQAARYAQAVLGALSCALLMIFAAYVANRREAFLSGLLAAVYPGFFWMPRVLLSENVALFLMLAALVSAAEFARTRRTAWVFASGALLGAGTLVRSATLLVLPILLVALAFVLWRRRERMRETVAPLALAAVAFALALAPWAARNYQAFGRFVPVATQDGIGLYASYWPPETNGRRVWGNLPGAEDPVVAEASRAGDEAEVSNRFRAETLRKLSEDPARYFRLLPEKFMSLVAPFDWEWFPHGEGRTRSFNVAYVFLSPFALLGAWLMFRRRRAERQWLLWVAPLAAIAQTLIFYGSPRFRLPAETSAMIWASVAFVWVADFLKGRASLYHVRDKNP